MANRTIGILGLGIFGQSVLKTLQDQDVDIIAIDDHEDVINQYESMITTGIVGDITEMDLLDAADMGTVTQLSSQQVKIWNQVSWRSCTVRHLASSTSLPRLRMK